MNMGCGFSFFSSNLLHRHFEAVTYRHINSDPSMTCINYESGQCIIEIASHSLFIMLAGPRPIPSSRTSYLERTG